MKKLCTIYPCGLNKRAKNSNLEQPKGKIFPPLPRFSNRRENLEKRRVNEPTKFYVFDTLLAHIVTFPPENRSDNLRIDLRKLLSNATDKLKAYDNTKKRCCELIIDIFLTKVFQTDKKVKKKLPPFAISVFFHNKRFEYINLGSILHLHIVKILFPKK